MKQKTFLRLALVGFLGLASLLCYLWLTTPTHRINCASFDKITEGMSMQEVEAILRCPPGKYCSSSAMLEMQRPDGSIYGETVDTIDKDIPPDHFGRPAVWVGDDGVIWVFLDAKGKVTEKGFGKMYVEGIMEKSRKWLAEHF